MKKSTDRQTLWRRLDEMIKGALAHSNFLNTKIDSVYQHSRDLLTKSGLRRATDYNFCLNPDFKMTYSLENVPITVFPGVRSDERRMLQLRLDFVRELERRFGLPVLDENGMSGPSAYAHDATKALSVSGLRPNKGGVHPHSNIHHRRLLGLSDDWFSAADAELARAFFSLLFGIVKAKPVKIPSKSQSVAPLFCYSRGYKVLNFCYAVNHLDEVLDLASDRDFTLLRDKFDIVFCSVQGSRSQSDAGGKKRYVIERSDGMKDVYKEVQIDNSVSIDKVPEALTRHFATDRHRYVFGMNNTVNSIINCIGGSAREVYGSEFFEFTFKHRSIEHMLNKLSKWAHGVEGKRVRIDDFPSVFLDVTSYDRSMLYRFIEVMVDMFKGEPIYEFIKCSAFSPLVIRCNDRGVIPEDQTIWADGDPLDFDPNDFRHHGLLSGWGWVSDAGKWAALAIYLVACHAKLVSRDIRELVSFLQGEHPDFCCFNLGDDNVVFGTPAFMDKWKASFKSSPYWVFDYEAGCRFIGHIFVNDGDGFYDIYNDPITVVTNILNPERSWQTKLRKYPAHGINQKMSNLRSPFGKDCLDILSACYEKNIGSNFWGMIADEVQKEQKLMLDDADDEDYFYILRDHFGVDLALRDSIMSDLLRDPKVIDWKYTDEDIFRAFGVDLHVLEGRPSVHFTEKVLSRSGYEPLYDCNIDRESFHVLSNYDEQDASGYWIHRSIPDDVRTILMELLNAKV